MLFISLSLGELILLFIIYHAIDHKKFRKVLVGFLVITLAFIAKIFFHFLGSDSISMMFFILLLILGGIDLLSVVVEIVMTAILRFYRDFKK